jgi:hypothetical protein
MIRIAEIIAGLVAAALVAALFVAKSGTANEEQKLAELQAELARERGRISALRAEIAHQEDHDNLRRLARLNDQNIDTDLDDVTAHVSYTVPERN